MAQSKNSKSNNTKTGTKKDTASKKTAGNSSSKQSVKTTAKKTSGNKTTANASGNKTAAKASASKRTVNVQAEEKETLSKTGVIILGVVIAAALELCNFNIFGTVGGYLQYGMFGLFGVMGYVFPLFVLAGFVVSTLEERKRTIATAGVLFFIFLCTFVHLVTSTSLDNTNILSFFTICAEQKTGGGIIGGALALGLFTLLSKTGAIIICIAIFLVCLFLILEEPVKNLIEAIKEDDEELEEESVYEEEVEAPRRAKVRQYKEPVLETASEDGTVIKIVRRSRRVGRTHTTKLLRTTKKAQPMRDGTIETQRTQTKVRGLGTDLNIAPELVSGDEIHEITEKKSRKKQEKKPVKKLTISDIPITENEARVTDVKEAKVNLRAKEEKPVKLSRAEREEIEKQEKKAEPVKKEIREKPVAKKAMPQKENYYAPPMDLLGRVKSKAKGSDAELEKTARSLEIILEQFGVNVTVTDIQAGPSVTRYELAPELGTRVSKITSLTDDLKLNLGVTDIRIEAPIPGRQAVGIEIPNKTKQTVYMRELLEEPTLINHPSKIAFAAGKDISGNVIVADIAKMPHLLVAGTTGSGKSTFINTILMTILFRAKPSEVGLIIIDPKKIEFGVYAGIPHLMKEVVTDPGQAVSTLRWAVNEMTNRYQRMQLSSVRDFKSYNAKIDNGTVSPAEENPKRMNQIVIIIDELADLMMVAKKEAEGLICRLAQLARAAGIHLIIATQRPSVDVVTGLIKANIPARVALLVASQIDSRTIIDMQGAEKLLGNGDMLFYPTGYVKPVRVQGAYVTDKEILDTVDYLIRNNDADYFASEAVEIEKYMNGNTDGQMSFDTSEKSGSGKYDECFFEAGNFCIEIGKASSSMLQRKFGLGFNRAARIIDQLEEFGVVGPQNGAKPREILVDSITFEEMYQELKES